MADEYSKAIEQAAELILRSGCVTAFTGAGMSTESGIPDFRSPGGIWSKANPDEFTIQSFMADSENRKRHWSLFSESGLTLDMEPNPGHYALAELERLGKLRCIITQNVDNLHQKAGSSPENVLELHGNMQRVVCMSCREVTPMREVLKRLAMDSAPQCLLCGGILKPDAVFFGEMLPQQILADSAEISRQSDLFIVIGSTLVVYPAAYMPVYALEAGAKLIIINLSETPLDQYADVRITGKAGEFMPRIVDTVKAGMAL